MYNTFLPSLINREWAADDNAYFGNIVDSLWKSFDLPAVFSEKGEWSPAIDVSETEAAYLVKAELPGLDKEAIDISINDGVLTVSGEKKMETREVDVRNRCRRSWSAMRCNKSPVILVSKKRNGSLVSLMRKSEMRLMLTRTPTWRRIQLRKKSTAI